MSVGVRYGAIRMRWRESDNVTVLMTPGKAYQVTVDMWSTAYIWNPGHSIRVHITSSRTPEFTVNPNNGYPLINTTGPMIVAQNTIIQDLSMLSYVTLPVVDINSLPVNSKIR